MTATGEFKNNTCGVTAHRQDVEREAVHPFLGPCLKSDRKCVCLSFLKHSPPSNIQLRAALRRGQGVFTLREHRARLSSSCWIPQSLPALGLAHTSTRLALRRTSLLNNESEQNKGVEVLYFI